MLKKPITDPYPTFFYADDTSFHKPQETMMTITFLKNRSAVFHINTKMEEEVNANY